MRKILHILFVLGLFVGGCGYHGGGSFRSDYDFSQIERIAIVDIQGEMFNETQKKTIEGFFGIELLDKGYAPFSRSRVNALVEQLESSEETGLITIDRYTEIGGLLHSQAVLVIDMQQFNEKLSIRAELINVADGTLLWMDFDSGSITTKTRLDPYTERFTMAPHLQDLQAAMTSQTAPSASSTPTVPVQQDLTEEEYYKIEKLVRKICRSLPTRNQRQVNW